MAIAKQNKDYAAEDALYERSIPDANPDGIRQAKLTSISARTVLTISVSMSVTEMDTLIDSFGKSVGEMTPGERNVQAEFAQAIEDIR